MANCSSLRRARRQHMRNRQICMSPRTTGYTVHLKTPYWHGQTLTLQFHQFLGTHQPSARRVLEPALLIKTFGSKPQLASVQFMSLIALCVSSEAVTYCVWPEHQSVFQSTRNTWWSNTAKQIHTEMHPALSCFFLTHICYIGITRESVAALFRSRLQWKCYWGRLPL